MPSPEQLKISELERAVTELEVDKTKLAAQNQRLNEKFDTDVLYTKLGEANRTIGTLETKVQVAAAEKEKFQNKYEAERAEHRVTTTLLQGRTGELAEALK